MSVAPLVLDDIERYGATRMGYAVKRVIVVYEDDRQAAFDLPRPFNAPASEDAVRESRIIAFMSKLPPGEKVKGEVIAAELEEEYDTIRKTLSALVVREILYAKQGVRGYSRGPKFPLS